MTSPARSSSTRPRRGDPCLVNFALFRRPERTDKMGLCGFRVGSAWFCSFLLASSSPFRYVQRGSLASGQIRSVLFNSAHFRALILYSACARELSGDREACFRESFFGLFFVFLRFFGLTKCVFGCILYDIGSIRSRCSPQKAANDESMRCESAAGPPGVAGRGIPKKVRKKFGKAFDKAQKCAIFYITRLIRRQELELAGVIIERAH